MSWRPLVTTVLLIALGCAILWEAGRHRSGPGQAESIRESIEAATDVGEVRDLDVRVDGSRRIAEISGRVESQEELLAVTEAAKRVRGLLTVYNGVRVDTLLEELLVRLRQLLLADPTEGEFTYRVAPDGHTVTLDGWVPEGEDDLRDQIVLLVERVPGVWKVHDNIRVGAPDDDINLVQEMIFDILRLGNIYFDYNRATIRPESQDSVKKIAGVLQEYPNVRVLVEGHTDSIASEQYNQALSDRRAQSVKEALVEYGTAPERIDTTGHGETVPIAPNDTPEGRAENRRIEFRIQRPDESAE